MNYKLSPSDLTSLYNGCKRCFYQRMVNNIAQPSFHKRFGDGTGEHSSHIGYGQLANSQDRTTSEKETQSGTKFSFIPAYYDCIPFPR